VLGHLVANPEEEGSICRDRWQRIGTVGTLFIGISEIPGTKCISKSGNPDEWGTTVSTARQDDRGVAEASCQRPGGSRVGYRGSRFDIANAENPTG
jgi:hypothetical protein